MAKALDPNNWQSVPPQIVIGTRCRIGTPTRYPRNATITSVQKTYRAIEIYGKTTESKPEELLAKIDIEEDNGAIQTTVVGGLILTWFNRHNLASGSLVTFPQQVPLQLVAQKK